MPPPVLRKRSNDLAGMRESKVKARTFLAIACFWPLALLALFSSSSSPSVPVSSGETASQDDSNSQQNLAESVRMNLRNALDRVDVLGYGPTHPRVAFAVVGDNPEHLVTTVETIFRNTDMNRIFVVTVVVDGYSEDATLMERFSKIDQGEVPHWHGTRADVHAAKDKDELHSTKVHVMFNPEPRGVAESRADAVAFIKLLEKQHVTNGLKSLQEDLILMLMQGGAQLMARTWLDPVTKALIVPPPLLDDSSALKLANAVAFNIEGPAKCTGFDATFTAKIIDADADEINRSSGESYPTPALNGAAVAMRLGTFLNLPLQDLSLTDPWTANLDLALNLWLCADGIDMLTGVEISSMEQRPPFALTPAMTARFAAAWMDEVTSRKLYNAFTKEQPEVTFLEWQTFMAEARQSPSFTADLPTRCRSFEWYAKHINPGVSSVLLEQALADADVSNVNSGYTPGQHTPKPVLHKAPDEVPDGEVAQDEAVAPARRAAAVEATPPPRKKPSKPLCDECLKIVQTAKPVDLAYVDVSGGHKQHPHMGATDAEGNLGYVADETALRKNPPSFNYDPAEMKQGCEKRDNNYRMLTERVYVDNEYEDSMKDKPNRAKLFCLVYTIESNIPDKNGHRRVPAIHETWGQKCDGFIVASNATDVELGTVNIVHQGPEKYENIWQKVRSMWSYVYDNYYDKYDYFHIGGDDLFLIVENLREYLESEEIRTASNGGIYLPDGTETTQTPLFLGRRFAYMGDMDDIFISGGSGYTMNKAALKTLVVDGLPTYFANARTFSEDTMTARIFKKFGILPYETKDENGGERYMPFMPGHHYGYRLPKDKEGDWYAKYSINIKEGPEHSSPKSVAFHYVKDHDMYRLFALLYKKCPAQVA